jgi:predicted Zn-dependent peptidase
MTVYAVNRKDSSQSVVRIASPGISRRDPDYTTISLANVIFGGSFTSRLNQNLREDKGYTYGCGSNFNPLRGQGLFFSGASVRANVTGESLREIQREYRRFLELGLDEDELQKARATLVNRIIESLETIQGTVGLFSDLASAGFEPNALIKQLEEIQTANAGQVLQAARRVLDWSQVRMFLVGDLEQINAEPK